MSGKGKKKTNGGKKDAKKNYIIAMITKKSIQAAESRGQIDTSGLKSIACYYGMKESTKKKKNEPIAFLTTKKNKCEWISVNKAALENRRHINDIHLHRRVDTRGKHKRRDVEPDIYRFGTHGKNKTQFPDSKWLYWRDQMTDGFVTSATVVKEDGFEYVRPNWKRIDASFCNKAYARKYEELSTEGKVHYGNYMQEIDAYLTRNFTRSQMEGNVDYCWNAQLWTNLALHQSGSTHDGEESCITWKGGMRKDRNRMRPTVAGGPRSLAIHPAELDRLLLDGSPPVFKDRKEASLSTISHFCSNGHFCSKGLHTAFESHGYNTTRQACHRIDSCIKNCEHNPPCKPVIHGKPIICYDHRDVECPTDDDDTDSNFSIDDDDMNNDGTE